MIKHAAFILVLLATGLFAGCGPDDDPVPVERQRSFLHILGGAAVDTFDVSFDYFNVTDVVIPGFYHKRNWPIQGYANLQAGGIPDEFGNNELLISASRQPFVNDPIDTILPPTAIVLAPDEQATLCFADSLGTLVAVKFVDNIEFANDTTALVRFINLGPDQATAGLSTTNGAFNQMGVGFLQGTEFSVMPRGATDFELTDVNGTVISTSTINLSSRLAYTIYLSGSGNGSFDYFVH